MVISSMFSHRVNDGIALMDTNDLANSQVWQQLEQIGRIFCYLISHQQSSTHVL
jgi:hypothetical protein